MRQPGISDIRSGKFQLSELSKLFQVGQVRVGDSGRRQVERLKLCQSLQVVNARSCQESTEIDRRSGSRTVQINGPFVSDIGPAQIQLREGLELPQDRHLDVGTAGSSKGHADNICRVVRSARETIQEPVQPWCLRAGKRSPAGPLPVIVGMATGPSNRHNGVMLNHREPGDPDYLQLGTGRSPPSASKTFY